MLNVEDGATADQTDAEILAAVESESGRDMSVDGAKLDGIEAGATADQTAAEILTAIKTVDGTGSGLDADLLDGQDSSAFATSAQGALADSAVQPGDIDTLAELNAIITDATLIDTTDSRLSDARTPTAHTHTASDLDFAGSTDIGADLADADEVLVSDGGGNTTRVKSALSRFWTYIKAKIESVGLSSLNITGDLTVDTTTLHVDSANNRVGIGTASPADSADVVGKLLIRNGQDSVGSQNKECVRFGFGSGDNYQHYLATRHNAASTQNAIEFSTSTGVASGSYPANAQHGLTIESGRVGVATGHDTSPANTLQIGTGSIGFTANSGTWDGATISGNQSFSGQVELTGQAASTDDSAMTRSLGDARYAVTLTSYKTANEDKTSDTTRADDSELALSLEASSTYIFEIILPYWTLDGTTTQGIDFGVSVPTGTTIEGHYDVAVSDSWQYRGRRFYATTTRAVNTGNGSGEAQVRIKGTIKTSTTAGTFAPQWAQAVSSANRTRVSYGAYMIAHKIQ
jgi:hypothetical protein